MGIGVSLKGANGTNGTHGSNGSNGASGNANVIFSNWNEASNVRDSTIDGSAVVIATLPAPSWGSQSLNPVMLYRFMIRMACRKGTRTKEGRPGDHYWQNDARYRIQVTLDPAKNLLSGNVHIDYHNASPDTLRQFVLKLYPNLYQAQSMRNVQLAARDLTAGVDLDSVKLDDLERISPGARAQLDIVYSSPVNKTSFVRTGQVDSGSYVIAYFFPRITVYDDKSGCCFSAGDHSPDRCRNGRRHDNRYHYCRRSGIGE